MAEDIFTLELSENKVKVVESQVKNNAIEVVNMGMDDIDPLFFITDSNTIIEKTAKIASNLIKQLKIDKKTVRIVIPDSYSYNNFIEMPDMNEKELLAAVKYQADQLIPM